MARFPWVVNELREEVFWIIEALADGSFFEITSIYDDRNFPDPPACNADFGGGE